MSEPAPAPADPPAEAEVLPPESPEASGPGAAQAARIKELEDQILRMQADFDNFRKRLARDRDESLRFANQTLLEDLLPIFDNFELGLKAAESGGDAKAILMGMSMVKSQMERFLTDQGLVSIWPEGSLFDPHLHEAVSTELTDTVPDGTIVAVQRKGYKLKDRLLRPAAVVVAHPPASAEVPADEPTAS
ncbi:MAG: nucleotide exchange factor GrpE [Verrucomicrobiia bacterium]